MTQIKKIYGRILLLAMMFLLYAVQLKAQDDFFDDNDGPGGFDPPADNDVPLDTYQWVMLAMALAYGIYVFLKHHHKQQSKTSISIINPAMG